MVKKTFRIIFITIILSSASILLGQRVEIDERNLDQAPANEDKIEALLNFAWNYKSSDSKKALLYGKEALQIAKRLTSQKLIADANHTIGMVNWYRGDYQQASKYFFDALYIREVINDELGLSRSYNNIGNLFFLQKNYKEALKYYSDGLEIRKSLKDSTGLIYSYNNLGDVFVKQELPDEAKGNYFRALEIAKEMKHTRGEAFVLYNLGTLYESIGKRDSAIILLNQSMRIADANNDDGQVSKNLVQLAAIDIEQGLYSEAIPKALKARKVSEALGAKPVLAESCEKLATAFAGNGQYEEAYKENLIFNKLSKELSNAEIEKTLKEVQYNYEDAREKLTLSERVRKLSANALILLVITLLMALIAALSIWVRYRSQRKNNKLLQQNNQYIKEQNEALLRSNSALEQFAYVASHDLKEPLRNINTYSFLLSENLKGDAKDTAKEYLGLISEGAGHMNDLLQGILAYSRLTQNTHALNEVVDLNHALEKVKETLGNIIQEKKVTIESDFLPTIRSNKMQIYQLFQNLISNAIKFNDKEQPLIQIRYWKEADGHHFEFKDNGIGFDEKYKEKIFQIFQRLEGRKYAGTGVGMAICRNIVEQHHGDISVTSTPGIGTSFFIHLPFMDSTEN